MKYFNYTILLLLILSACKDPSKEKITFEDIKDSSHRAAPTKIEENITFFDTQNKIISTDKFNQLLAEGLYLSEQKQKIDGSEEVHLVSIKEHAKKLEAQPLPDFELSNLRGDRYTKQSLAGKVTILSFWFTASHICTKDIQDLNALAKKYANNKNCIWIAPALDSPANLSRFLRGKSWNFDFAADQELLALKFGIITYPTHLIIDKQGNISKAVIRHPKTNEVVEQTIQNLLS
ncbi:peroxiredoxin [Aureispira sp. CCB-QB1]|uniref:peroxiredoxin family protein n=1 Tax=Aureispira sp. CCB-QB1 TaxID=1313421 RepID=UPI000698F486|nr:TlpA disulfide reductase family protein [Aureispira sp. CCB-QB1]